MKKLFLIVRSNMRKSKGQTAAIVVLILIAAMLFNLWLMLSADYKENFQRHHDKLNSEHVTVAIDGDSDTMREFLTQTLTDDNRVSEFRLDSCLNMTGSFPYNGSDMNNWLVFVDKPTALTRTVGKAEIVEDGSYASGVYLPMLYKTDDIAIGKTVKITVGSNNVEYTVCGFFNNPMMGSHNCGMTEIILTKDKYDELDNLGYALKATLCSARLYDKTQNVNFEAELKISVSSYAPNTYMISNGYDMVLQARYISQGVCCNVISAMAFFVLLIALVVIVSNIVNYIQVNMRNLGALKAVGYTSNQLINSLLLQFLGLTLLSAIVGAALSYGIFPALNGMMIAQTGIPYAIRFLPLPIVVTIAILGGAVALAVYLASRKIKTIEPIVALRSGVQTHNFKRNRVPLEKTKAPLNFALALKTTLSGIKHNLTVCITMLVLSLIVVFSGVMTANMIADTTSFINLIVGETADSCVSVSVEIEDDFVKEMDNDVRVEKVYLYNTVSATHTGGAELLIVLCDDFSKANNQSVVYKGRFPKYDNEIAIGAKYAKENGFEVGNEIEITANGKTEKYIISGLTQVTNYLGRDGLLTRQGYGRLGELSDVTYYMNIADGTDTDEFNAEVKEKFAGNVNTTVNVQTTVESAASVYVSLMTIIVIAILFLSAIIIAFVLYLLVRTMFNNKMRDYGIMKSLGFTTGQLILQTALSFMPAIILSTVVGLVVSGVGINPLLSVFFSSLGILKCTLTVPIGFITIAGIVLILVSFGIACLISLKVKKITPRALLAGE